MTRNIQFVLRALTDARNAVDSIRAAVGVVDTTAENNMLRDALEAANDVAALVDSAFRGVADEVVENAR